MFCEPLSLRRVQHWAKVALALAFAACGGSTYEGGEYREGAIRYRAPSPGAGWEAIDVEGQNDLAWRSPSLGAIIQVNATCDPDMDVPLSALRNHLLIGLTEREVQSEETISLDGREALRTHVVAKLDGVPREMLLTVLKKDGCVYDFALVTPPGSGFAQASQRYDALLAGFTTLEAPE